MIIKEENASSQVLEHLGFVASVIKDIGLISKIDERIPVSKEKGAKLTIGQRVVAMILNGLDFIDKRLYMFPQFLEKKSVHRLFDGNVCAADFNDDSLGRSLYQHRCHQEQCLSDPIIGHYLKSKGALSHRWGPLKLQGRINWNFIKKMTTIIRLIIITTLYASSINAKGMRTLAPPRVQDEPPNIGLLALPSSQQPAPLISFGQTLMDKNNLQWLTIPTYLQKTNHDSESTVISTFVYGLTDSIALSLNLPYHVLNKIDQNHSSGLADVGLNAEFAFFSASNSSYTTQATVLSTITLPSGFYEPTSSFDEDPSIGIGALSYFIGTTFNRIYLNWWWFVSPGVTWISPHHDMHDGTVYFFQGGIGQLISSSANHYIFSGLLEFDGSYEGKAKIAGIDDPESGGYNILITPSLNYSAKNWQIQGGVSFPLLQQWNGDQPNINYLAIVSFTLTLN